MDLKIINKTEKKLLSRLEVDAEAGFTNEATPSNDKVKEAIAKEVGKDAKLVVVKKIATNYGDASASIKAYVYENEAKLDELEVTHKKGKEGEAKEEAAPANEY
jgi:ribosomal protein S24E